MAAYCRDLDPLWFNYLLWWRRAARQGGGQAKPTTLWLMGPGPRKWVMETESRGETRKGTIKRKRSREKNRKERNNGRRSERNDRSSKKVRMDVTYAEDLWRNKTRWSREGWRLCGMTSFLCCTVRLHSCCRGKYVHTRIQIQYSVDKRMHSLSMCMRHYN